MHLHLFAYLDLASGSMIIQAAIAGIVAVPILFRNQLRRLLGRTKPSDEASVDEPVAGATADPRPDAHADGSDAGHP
ncbi:MAG: hypothetical protein U0667_06685 [Chloroflexota bacterium]